MILKLRITLLFILCSGFLYSQVPQDDVIYLNNGSFLVGKLIEIIPEKSLKLVVADNDTMLIQLSDVKMMKKQDHIVPVGRKGNFRYRFIPEVAVNNGWVDGSDRLSGRTYQFSMAISVFNGVTIGEHVYLGIGTGVEIWDKRQFVPVYIDFRSLILKKRTTPFFYINGGIAPQWASGSFEIGGTAGLGIGMRLPVSSKLSATFSTGYRYLEVRSMGNDTGRGSHFVSFRLGMIF